MTIRIAERLLLAIGIMLLASWAAVRFHQAVISRAEITRFLATDEPALTEDTSGLLDPIPDSQIDFRLWSPKRISAYKDSLIKKTDAPIAILRIPKIDLEVPVFNDTDDLTLNRGVGRILGTAQIGQPGNLGIAGHRDGFFRGLQSIDLGDLAELVRPGSIEKYTVNKIQIVAPEDVQVLDPTPVPTLTLVTCFPFYFVGSAPKRYIITAPLKSSSEPGLADDKKPFQQARNTTN